MGWTFPWYSSRRSDFSYDFHACFDESRALRLTFAGGGCLDRFSSTTGGTEIDSFRTVMFPAYLMVGTSSYHEARCRRAPVAASACLAGRTLLVIIIGGTLGGRMALVCASGSWRELP